MQPYVPTDEEVARWAAEKLADSRLMELPRDLMGVVLLHVDAARRNEPHQKNMTWLWQYMTKVQHLQVHKCQKCYVDVIDFDTMKGTIAYCPVDFCDAFTCENCCKKSHLNTCGCNNVYCTDHIEHTDRCERCQRVVCSYCYSDVCAYHTKHV